MNTPAPIPPPTFGSKLKAEESKIWTFLKTNWAHFVTWAGIAYSFLKHV